MYQFLFNIVYTYIIFVFKKEFNMNHSQTFYWNTETEIGNFLSTIYYWNAYFSKYIFLYILHHHLHDQDNTVPKPFGRIHFMLTIEY